MVVLRSDKDIVCLLDKLLIVVVYFVILVASSSVGEDSIVWLVYANISLSYVDSVVVGKNSFEVVVCWERSVGGIG